MTADMRFDVPLYTVAEIARLLDMPARTLQRWTKRDGLIHTLKPETPRSPSLPFIAVAEAQFYRQLRREGLSLQAITAGMKVVRQKLGDQMLMQGRLAHDGTNILMNLPDADAATGWTVARTMQGGIPGVIERCLQPIVWDKDEFPQKVRLTAYEGADIIIDPRFAFGQPIVAKNGVRADDIFEMFKAGDSMETVSAEFGVEPAVIEAIVRFRAA
jgi:uncharacterized protein (DUF433 family)